MYDGIKLFLEWVGYFFIAYLIGYSTFLFLSVVVGSLELYKHRRQEMFKSILPSDYYLPISIIVPAYNEEVTVVDTVRSLLTLEYRAYEIIVVDDGSKDRTSEVLAETFDMHLVHRPIRRQINCQREEYVYETRAQKVPVTLIRKKNGGKADALNIGFKAVCIYLSHRGPPFFGGWGKEPVMSSPIYYTDFPHYHQQVNYIRF